MAVKCSQTMLRTYDQTPSFGIAQFYGLAYFFLGTVKVMCHDYPLTAFYTIGLHYCVT